MYYKAALIGCGKIASQFASDPKIKGIYTHAEAYSLCPDTRLVAVCDINVVAASLCAQRWNVSNFYTDAKEMLCKEKPDIVSICTPDATHADILALVLNTPSVKGVLMEKPIALDVNRAYHLVNQAKIRNIPLVINYNRRYATGHQKVKKKLKGGDFGAIKKVSGYYTKGIIHNGTHWIDLARWLIGEISYVQGFNHTSYMADDPTVDAWLKFNNGAIGYLHGIETNSFSIFEMDIVGLHGRVRITNSGYDIEYFNVTDSQYFSGYKAFEKYSHERDEICNTLLSSIVDLVNSIVCSSMPICTGDDGLSALRIATQLIHSSQTGVIVDLQGDSYGNQVLL